jgi:hypothetical protein
METETELLIKVLSVSVEVRIMKNLVENFVSKVRTPVSRNFMHSLQHPFSCVCVLIEDRQRKPHTSSTERGEGGGGGGDMIYDPAE